jgi:ligand-binding sensor domain-containing protein
MGRKLKSVIACCCLYAFFCQNIFSQLEISGFSTQVHYSEESGLGSTYITDIHEEKNGFLWLGTGSGVSRFDGSSFTNFEYFLKNSKEMELGFVNKLLFEESSDRLWVGSDQGLFKTSLLKI